VDVSTLLALFEVLESDLEATVQQVSNSGCISSSDLASNLTFNNWKTGNHHFVLIVLLLVPLDTRGKDFLSLQLLHARVLIDGRIFSQGFVKLFAVLGSEVWELHEWILEDPAELHQVLRELDEPQDVVAIDLLSSLAHSEFDNDADALFNDDVKVGGHISEDFLQVSLHHGVTVKLLLVDEAAHVSHQQADWLDLSLSSCDWLRNRLLDKR